MVVFLCLFIPALFLYLFTGPSIILEMKSCRNFFLLVLSALWHVSACRTRSNACCILLSEVAVFCEAEGMPWAKPVHAVASWQWMAVLFAKRVNYVCKPVPFLPQWSDQSAVLFCSFLRSARVVDGRCGHMLLVNKAYPPGQQFLLTVVTLTAATLTSNLIGPIGG